MEDKYYTVKLGDRLSVYAARIIKVFAHLRHQFGSSLSDKNLDKLSLNLTSNAKKSIRNLRSYFSDIPEKFGRLKYYLNIWLIMSKNSFLVVLSKKLLLLMFLLGKLIRFSFFTVFLFFAVKGAGGLAGYSVDQAIFFFLTFNIIDVTTQFLFREVYKFRNLVTSGDLDLVMVKPMRTLFRVLLGGADVIDLITIPPLIVATWYVGARLGPSSADVLLYIILIINGIIIGAAFHIAVLAFGIITYEVDHTILIYRDLSSLGRLPVDVYSPIIRTILTYFLPVAIMITFPAKVLMDFSTPAGVLMALMFGIIAILLSTRLWDLALRKYSSASS